MRETTCKQLSTKAREIFDKIKAFFPPDYEGNPRWRKVGKVFTSNLLVGPRWYDLRKTRDVRALMVEQSKLADMILDDKALVYRVRHGDSLKGFGRQRFSRRIERWLEIKWLCIDLMHQLCIDHLHSIETLQKNFEARRIFDPEEAKEVLKQAKELIKKHGG